MDFRRVQQILLRARELAPPERESFLARECSGDDALRQEVESLLAHDTREPVILRPGMAGQALAQSLGGQAPPEQVGSFRLLEVLGEGGMGVVYRALQEGPLPRQAAVKLLRWGGASASARARFDVERAVLARMEHPGIARVFDAGTDELGRPWVAMELVAGQPITRWCDEHQASLRERVILLRDVCQAIQHAHQKGVLHRDLKPSNILVDEHEGRPRARVIDFGIAKGLDDALGGASMTLAGELVGTPEYMSPEQAGADAASVDTRSDLYSLGVVLHELLVGDTPIGRQTLERSSLAEVLALLREQQAQPPSRKFRSLAIAAQEAVATGRATRPDLLLRAVSGDLDAVVSRALERSPDRRYASVAALAEDLDRWLRREPVEAALPGPMRRLAAAARRRRGTFAALVTGVAVLLAGAATTSWQAARAHQQRVVAEQRLEDIRNFVIDLIFKLDSRLGDVAGTAEVRRFLSRQTVVQLARIGEDPQALARLRVPLAIAHRRLSYIQKELGDIAAADSSLRAGIDLLDAELRARPDQLAPRRELAAQLDSRSTLHNMRGDRQLALEDAQRALAQFERLAALDPTEKERQRDLNTCRSSVAAKLLAVGRLEEGVRMRELSIEGRRRVVREFPDDLDQVSFLGREVRRLAEYWEDQGRVDLSDPLYREALGHLRRVYEAAPANADYKHEFGGALHAMGRHLCVTGHVEEGLAMLHEAWRVREEELAASPTRLRYVVDLTNTLCTIGDSELDRDRAAAALPLYQRADSLLTAALQASPKNALLVVNRGWAQQLVGRARLHLGASAAAESTLRAALATLGQVQLDNNNGAQWRTASVECDLGDVFSRRTDGDAPAAARADRRASLRWYDAGLARMHALRERGALQQWQLDEIGWREQRRAERAAGWIGD